MVGGGSQPRSELRNEAQGKWRSILPQLGVPVSFLDGKQHPCPICGGRDRARFDDIDGHGTFFCNQCGAGNGMSLAMKVLDLGFADMAARVRALLPDAQTAPAKPPRDEEQCARWHREVWRSSLPLAGTIGERYLRSRGAWSDHLRDHVALRFVPRLRASKHEDGHLPAIVAKVTDPAGLGVNVHRTFIKNGRRAYRAMMAGSVPAGAAIRLFPEASEIGIAEGIETALRAAQRFGLPVWSALNAGQLEKWEPPAGTTKAHIFGDADEKYAGQASAFILGRRLSNRRDAVPCAVHIPDQLGTDWADNDAVVRAA